MELVVVERRFEQPIAVEDLEGRERAGAWCLDAYNVRFVKSYFSNDRRRTRCLYEAPEAEAVRSAEKEARVPFDRAWTCQILQGPPRPDNAAQEYVVVERAFSSPVTAAFLSNAFRGSRSCFEIHRASYVESFLAKDGLNMFCVFRAPDAEAVRMANDQARAPYTDIWTASLHLP